MKKNLCAININKQQITQKIDQKIYKRDHQEKQVEKTGRAKLTRKKGKNKPNKKEPNQQK